MERNLNVEEVLEVSVKFVNRGEFADPIYKVMDGDCVVGFIEYYDGQWFGQFIGEVSFGGIWFFAMSKVIETLNDQLERRRRKDFFLMVAGAWKSLKEQVMKFWQFKKYRIFG